MSSLTDALLNWEKHSLSSLLAILVKWFSVTEVNQSTISRPEVASRVWITLTLQYEYNKKAKVMYIEGQTVEIVKRRLIDELDRWDIGGEARKLFLQKQKKETNGD